MRRKKSFVIISQIHSKIIAQNIKYKPMKTFFKKFAGFMKKEIMLSVSLAAVIVSFFITPPSKEILHGIDWKTLATLFMLLTVLEGFKNEDIFNPILRQTSRMKTIFSISCFLVFSVFISSMFVTNDVSLIIFVPLTIMIFKAGDKEKYLIPILTFENIAAIRGSLLTPFGSPQNLFLYSQSGISTPSFIKMMLPLWIFSAFLLLLFTAFLYRRNIREKLSIEEESFSRTQRTEKRGKQIFYIILFILVIATIVTRTKFWPLSTAIVLVSVLIFDRQILLKTDYVLIFTFLCFFTFSSSICRNDFISGVLQKNVAGHEYVWSILLSQVISNVPASIVLWPFSQNLRALLYGLDSAGLCSIIGSLASVINLRIYSKEYPGNSFKFIFWFTVISLAFFAAVVFPQLWILHLEMRP